MHNIHGVFASNAEFLGVSGALCNIHINWPWRFSTNRDFTVDITTAIFALEDAVVCVELCTSVDSITLTGFDNIKKRSVISDSLSGNVSVALIIERIRSSINYSCCFCSEAC